MDYKRYAEKITDQIFDGDNAFFLESGVDLDSAKAFEHPGGYGGIRYTVIRSDIKLLEITLEASDLYTVRVKKTVHGRAENVISITTRQPVEVSDSVHEVKVERVFAFDMIEVLHSLFYRNGVL